MGPMATLGLLALWGLTSAATAESAPGASADRHFIVRDGRPEAEIVVSDRPTRMAKWAAGELQEYVRKLTGAQLPTVTAPSRGCPAQVYVGRSVHTTALGVTDEGLRHGAFRMRSGPTWLVLLGSDKDFVPPSLLALGRDWADVRQDWDARTGGKWDLPYGEVRKHHDDRTGLWEYDDRGTVNAVHRFLEDLGVRWYFPGEIGEIVPSLRSIALPTANRTIRPDFAVRNWYQYYSEFFRDKRDELEWQLRLGLNFGQGSMGLGPMGHGISALLAVPEVQQARPEYFALWNGQRAIGTADEPGAPCLSSEGLIQAQVEYIRAQFDILEEPQVDVSPSDGYAYLCECELCKGKGTPERGWNGSLSDYVWAHVNRVAQEVYKTHPDRQVRCLAYTTYQQPPRQIDRLSPNLAVVLCRWRSDFYDPETRAQFARLVDEWLRRLPSGRLYIWDYYLHSVPSNPWGGVPVYFPHLIADDLRSLAGKSQGEFVEVARDWPEWNLPRHALATNHLNLYVTSRLYWDANLDVDALLAEYYEQFYGPAHAEMQAFVEYAEAHWMTARTDADAIDRLSALITDARRAAGDTVYGRRVAMVVEFMAPLLELRKELSDPRGTRAL